MKKLNYKLLTGILAAILACVTVASAQTSTWNVASGNWSNGFNWNPVGDPSGSAFNVIFNNSGSLNLDSSRSIGTYSQTGGILTIANGQTLSVAGAFTNNGTITMNSTSGNNLIIGNGSSLGAAGAITMSDHFANQIYARNHGDTLTIATGGSISGGGSLNIGFFGGTAHLLNFVNQGLIDATQPNALQVGMDSSVNANLTNTGILRASSGGTLRLRSFGPGMVFNAGGVIEALTGSNVRVISGITVEGGTVTSSGTGAIRGEVVGGSGGTLSNVTNTGTVAIANGENLGLAGTFTNNGILQLDSTGNGTSLLLRSDVTLAGAGPITMGNNFNNGIGGDGTLGYQLTVAPGATIQGGGHFGGNNNNFNPKIIKDRQSGSDRIDLRDDDLRE